MIQVTDYRAMLRHGDIKKICAITGLTPYLLKIRLDKHDYETVEIVKTYYAKKLEALKNQINDYSEN
jgi:hypothetical protein|tara:strand:+ start:1105 stop:1305 length:201 start_codon:yes stop_codon:yes gene_type:complete